MEPEATTPATFEPLIGADFHLDDQPVVLTLVEVRRLASHGSPRSEPFALTFAGPEEPRVEQGIHDLRHDDLGTTATFLVPIQPGPDGAPLYEAVYN